MDHQRWITVLLTVILLFGLSQIGVAEAGSLYEKVKRELAALKELKKSFVHHVTVEPGDTVYSIAQRYHTDVQTIALANDLHDPSLIHVGDRLRVPQAKGFYYEVQKGESLADIADTYGVPVETIKEMNPGIDQDELVTGKELFLKNPKRWPQKKSSNIQLASRNREPKKSTASDTSDAQSASAEATADRTFLGNFTLTAYTAGPESTGKRPGDPGYGITASGAKVKPGVTIAADPRIIPMGSTVYIEGIGTRVVQDTGSAIKGHRIDIYIPDLSEARQFGVKKDVKVYRVD